MPVSALFPDQTPRSPTNLFLAEEAEPPHFVEQRRSFNAAPRRRAGRPPRTQLASL